MNVVWLSHLLPFPPKGGVLQRSYNLLKEVSKYHDVHLIAFSQESLLKIHYSTTSEGINDTTENLKSICKSVTSVPMPLSWAPYTKNLLAFFSLFSRYPYTINWLNSNSYRELIIEILNRESIDLIYCDTISLGIYQDVFGEIPFVIGHHNIESDMMFRRAENESNFIKKLYFQLEAKKIEKYEKELGQTAKLNVTCSDLDTERLGSLIPDNEIVTVPNGVDLSYFSAEPKHITNKDSINFIFAGRLNAYTNSKAAIFLADSVWPMLKKAFPGSKCFIVGSSPPLSLVKKAQSDDSLIVTGFVEDVRDYLREANIYICPINDGGGTKLKILDALAMGIPVIADPIACEGIEVIEGKTVFYAQDPGQYVQHARNLIDHHDLYVDASRNSIALVRDLYSYAAIGESFAQHLLHTRYCCAHRPQAQ
ncbi:MULTISPECIES: glycosyltransferase family 4 protein [Marinobacter]|uniref:glycosyltransferase family 4 protein n=1 Tax=Marinobacter TaxID=2742 RepID=UPI001D0D6CE1|nr:MULTISPECIES: glycosyltransferase family 4 protein [unclassified Marinobacter]